MKDLQIALVLSCLVACFGKLLTTPKPGWEWVLPSWILLTGFGYIATLFFNGIKNRGK